MILFILHSKEGKINLRGKKSVVSWEGRGRLFEGKGNVLIIIVVMITFDKTYEIISMVTNFSICK